MNKDIEVTDADIKSFCEDMKKEAQRNCLNEKDAEKVKTPTKNNLITWGILKEENGVIRPTYAYYYLRGLDGVASLFIMKRDFIRRNSKIVHSHKYEAKWNYSIE